MTNHTHRENGEMVQSGRMGDARIGAAVGPFKGGGVTCEVS